MRTAIGTHSQLLDTVPAYRDILSQKAEEIARICRRAYRTLSLSGYARIDCGARQALDLLTRGLRRYLRVEFWSWW